MKASRHLKTITQGPGVAQTNFAIKLEATTAIIDRILLADRQRDRKAVPSDGGGGGGVGGLPGGFDF